LFRSRLQRAASIAGLLMTTEAMVAEKRGGVKAWIEKHAPDAHQIMIEASAPNRKSRLPVGRAGRQSGSESR